MPPVRLLALLALTAATVRPLAAQETDSIPRWHVTGELSYTDVSGNKSLALLATGLGVRRGGGGSSELAFRVGMRYGKSNGTVAAENYETEASARFQPRSWVSPFFDAKATRDLIKNIDLRVATSAGAELNLFPGSSQRLSLGVAVLQDYERRILPVGSTDPRTLSRTRFNLRLVATPSIRQGVALDHKTQFQPVADDLGDYLFSSETALRVLLTGGLALQTSFVYNYDSTPAPGVTSRTDRALTTGLIVEL